MSSDGDLFSKCRYTSKAQVLTAVDAIAYTGGGTSTHLALNNVYQTMFTTAKGARVKTAGFPRVGIFLTDGSR